MQNLAERCEKIFMQANAIITIEAVASKNTITLIYQQYINKFGCYQLFHSLAIDLDEESPERAM